MAINISQHLKKEYWKRRINADTPNVEPPTLNEYYVKPYEFMPGVTEQLLTQENFMRENSPLAHDINSRFMSMRPVYDVEEVTVTDADGNIKTEPQWRVVGFDPVETVRFALQKRINLSKAAFMAGNGFWISHEDKNHDDATLLSSWKDSAGLDLAWLELVQSCFLTGDGAIYQYVQNNQLKFHVFSYLKGDTLFPDYDENRNFVLYRLYTLRGKRAVDIYSTTSIQTWIEGDKEESKEQNWLSRFGGWFRKGLDWGSSKLSEDGWRCVSDTKVQTPDGMNPVVYWRIDDIPSGIANADISALEKAASFVADGVKSVSQPILFLKATNIESLPEQDSTGKRIGVKGAVDEIAAADAKFLVPPDLSNIATIDLSNKEKSIRLSTLSVDITPEIFRSSDPSSASIKLLFSDTLIWCKNMFVQFYPGLCDLVEVFKALVAKIEIGKGKGGESIASMRTSCGCEFWIPQNDSEMLKRELDQVAYRVKSRKAAMSDIGSQHMEDYEQILKEWREELDLKARVPAEAQAQVDEKYAHLNADKINQQELKSELEPESNTDNQSVIPSKQVQDDERQLNDLTKNIDKDPEDNINLHIDNAAQGKSITH